MSAWRQNDQERWVPAEPLPEPFGVLWGRLWGERRRHGEPKWTALFASWRDARAVSRAADSQNLSTPASRGVEGGDADVTQQDALERAEARALLFGDALRAISTSGGNGHWLNVYRERGGGYEGLQAIAEHALARDRLIRDAESQEPSS